MFVSFTVINFFLLRMTVHASSPICLRDIREDGFSCGSVVAVFNLSDNYVERSRSPLFEGAILSASGNVTKGLE